jgi:hypothetical protein
MEGRRSKRVKPTRLVAVSVHFTGELIDISASGALVRCSHQLEIDTRGHLEIDLGGDKRFRTAVVVRRQIPDVGAAFQFIETPLHDRELLHRFLLRLSRRGSSKT